MEQGEGQGQEIYEYTSVVIKEYPFLTQPAEETQILLPRQPRLPQNLR